MNTKEIAEKVTRKMLAALENGVAPWKRPWKTRGGLLGTLAMPRNLVSNKEYRGINTVILAFADHATESPYWLTFKQCQQLGGKVRKGEHGETIVFWKRITIQDRETGEDKRIALLRYYTVFNLAQTEGVKIPAGRVIEAPAAPGDAAEADWSPTLAAEALLEKYTDGPNVVRREQNRAYYTPLTDVVTLPVDTQFMSAAGYYETFFHELVHSTGHERRLSRPGVTSPQRFGSEPYGREELVAESGAAMLCNMAGFEAESDENTAAYCQNWLENIKGDPSMLITAASEAQKAIDLMLGRKFEGEGGAP